jgi:hypothetical protein
MQEALNRVALRRAASDEVELVDLYILPGASTGHPAPAADFVADLATLLEIAIRLIPRPATQLGNSP